MHVVISQAYAQDDGFHADEYVRLSKDFVPFMRQHPGFLGRKLLRSLEDRRHFTHVRFFDKVESYEELTKMPGYMEWIDQIGAHTGNAGTSKVRNAYALKLELPGREYFEVVSDD